MQGMQFASLAIRLKGHSQSITGHSELVLRHQALTISILPTDKLRWCLYSLPARNTVAAPRRRCATRSTATNTSFRSSMSAPIAPVLLGPIFAILLPSAPPSLPRIPMAPATVTPTGLSSSSDWGVWGYALEAIVDTLLRRADGWV